MIKQVKNKKSKIPAAQDNSQLPVEKQEHTGFRGMSKENIKKLAIFTASTIVAAVVGSFPPSLVIVTLLLSVSVAILAYHIVFKNIFHGVKQPINSFMIDDQHNKAEVKTMKLLDEERNIQENLQKVQEEVRDTYQNDNLKESNFKKNISSEVKSEGIKGIQKQENLNSSKVERKSVIKQILHKGPDLITEKQLVDLQKDLKNELQKKDNKKDKEVVDKKNTHFQELVSRKNTNNMITRR